MVSVLALSGVEHLAGQTKDEKLGTKNVLDASPLSMKHYGVRERLVGSESG
jgi:hypothetical protein